MATIKEKGFASKLGFILAAAGSAVGLGNLWRFPWQVSKYGGGAFVLVYIIMVIFLGSTLMIAENTLGRIARGTVVDAYSKGGKGMKWIGILAVAIPFFITAYYTVIGGWSMKYTLNYVFERGFADGGVGGAYFGNYITSQYLAPLFSVAFLVIVILIVAKGVDKGIEKASKILFPTLFVMLVFLAIYSLCLKAKPGTPGVGAGLKYYLGSFDFKRLGWEGVVAAMSQSFFSLSLGMGVMVAYGSYTGKKLEAGKSALIICTLDTVVALIAGFIVFPTIFALDPQAYASAGSAAGPGLLFITLPNLFSVMPGGQFFGFLFFALVAFAALTSLISLLEVVSQYTLNRLGWTRKKATWVFGIVLAILSMFISLSFNSNSGFTFAGKVDLLTYLDEITNKILMPIAGFGSVLTIGWLIKKDKLFEMLDKSNTVFAKKKGVRDAMYYVIKFLSPLLILLVFIMGIYGNMQESIKGEGDFANLSTKYGSVLIGALVFIAVAAIGNIYLDSKHMQKLVKKAASVKFGSADQEYQYDPEEEALRAEAEMEAEMIEIEEADEESMIAEAEAMDVEAEDADAPAEKEEK